MELISFEEGGGNREGEKESVVVQSYRAVMGAGKGFYRGGRGRWWKSTIRLGRGNVAWYLGHKTGISSGKRRGGKKGEKER